VVLPHFDYLGEMMCSMAAFKQHCSFGFWKAALMKDPELMARAKSEEAMGHLGKITSPKDLPSEKKMVAYIKEAMKLNEDGVKVVKVKPAKTKELPVPDYFLNALKKNKKAFTQFENFPPSHRKEYIMWIVEATGGHARKENGAGRGVDRRRQGS
jgi:uncharacterized protein YdeI (YjbR/CyaY-like superfamily)